MGAGCGDGSSKWTPYSVTFSGSRSETSTPGSTVSSGSLSGRQLVRLNVGGKSFCTSLSTLNKERSMLSVLVSGAFAENPDDEIFIDRDGSRFVHVLNYLRDGKLNVDDYNRAKLSDLLDEADYFMMEGMRDLVMERLQEKLALEEQHRSRLDSLEEAVRRVALKAGYEAPEPVFSTEIDF